MTERQQVLNAKEISQKRKERHLFKANEYGNLF